MLQKEIKEFLDKVKAAGHVIRYVTIKENGQGTIYSGFIKVPMDDPNFLRQVLLQCDMINLKYNDKEVFDYLGIYPPGGAVKF